MVVDCIVPHIPWPSEIPQVMTIKRERERERERFSGYCETIAILWCTPAARPGKVDISFATFQISMLAGGSLFTVHYVVLRVWLPGIAQTID